MTPPTQNSANEVTRYSVPIVLWSVDVSHFTAARPGRRARGPADAGGAVTVLLSMPRLCPALAAPSQWSDATSVTPKGVTLTHLPDTDGS
ncbi:hypothetical protein GCM10023335_46180 [Streptomyces siamensis]|uniref:Uncharacterized protein n=1 Tax=Streptomyces siamensis TaxID=1274986 RepID=A0ABP9J4P3_9ACTN